jgi:AraC-like DNA-binding protein
MSVSTLNATLTKEFQTSPSMVSRRDLNAALLIANQKMRASDVYEEIGFENLSSFVQAYK